MNKCDMWKPKTDNQILPPGVPPMEKEKKNNIQDDMKILLERGGEVEKMMRFPNEIEIFKKICT